MSIFLLGNNLWGLIVFLLLFYCSFFFKKLCKLFSQDHKEARYTKFRLSSQGKIPQGLKPNNPLLIESSQNEISNPGPKTPLKVPRQPSSQVKLNCSEPRSFCSKYSQTSSNFAPATKDLALLTTSGKLRFSALTKTVAYLRFSRPCHIISGNSHLWL